MRTPVPPPPLWKDRIFEAVFSRLLVYTILFEDNEQDLEFLALAPGDRVFTIGGAGCGVAAMLGAAPAAIDVVDSNVKHLAVTALKVNAARRLESYDEFHELLARGRHDRPDEIVRRLAAGLPDRIAAFWKSGWRMFRRDFHSHGFYTKNLSLVRPFWPLTPDFLRALNRKPPDDRAREMFDVLSRAMSGRVLGALIRSPLSLLGAGINYTQRDRNLRAVGSTDVVDGVIDYATRVARTDIEENWIAWHIVTGAFNLDRPGCLPVYLRRDAHLRALGSPTEVRYHHGSVFTALAAAPPDAWTHVCLSDVPDWMGDAARRALFHEVYRAARPGARVVCRTVEQTTIVDELGLGDRFRVVEPMSAIASRSERSCLYRRVNCYEVVK